MYYRDFMQKYRPVYSPDEPAAAAPAGAGSSSDGDGAASAATASPAPDASTPAPAAAAEAPPAGAAAEAAGDAAPAAGAGADKSEPTLLEAAQGKKPAAEAAGEKDQPASPEAAKPDGEKTPEGDVKEAAAPDKEKGEDDKSKPDSDKQAAEGEAEKKDATAEAQPPAPIKYEAFKLPDGVKLDDERLSKFAEVAGNGQVSQDVAQNLIDLYIEERQQDFARAEQHQRDVWKSLNDGWKQELRNDPVLGGNRIDTNLSMAKAVLEEYGGTQEQVSALLAHTKANGMGNYPGFIRLLVNIGEALNVFEEGTIAGDTNPPKPQRGPGNRGWYDKSNMNGAGKAP
jgi:hypothetical protein